MTNGHAHNIIYFSLLPILCFVVGVSLIFPFPILPGKCDSLITECRRNQLQCTELYDGTGTDVCPQGHKKVTLKTSCGDDRDACAECSSLVTKSWSDSYPEKCYDEVKMTVMGQCPVMM